MNYCSIIFGLRLTNSLGPQALRTLGTSAQLSSRSWHVNATWNSHDGGQTLHWAKICVQMLCQKASRCLSPKCSALG